MEPYGTSLAQVQGGSSSMNMPGCSVCVCGGGWGGGGVPSEVLGFSHAYQAPGWDPGSLWTGVDHGLPGSACTSPVWHGCASSYK